MPFFGNNSAPVVNNESPTAGTVVGATTPLSFDVTDASGVLLSVLVAVQYENRTELAYDGSQWLSPYALGSSRAAIHNGFRFTTIRDNGWPSSPMVRVFAFDDESPDQQAP